MTLYWWTHWFWITPLSLKLYFLLFSLAWGSTVVQCMSLPFVHTSVQNGHQNGPYVTKSLDITEKINTQRTNSKELINYHTANYQEISHYSAEEEATTDETHSPTQTAAQGQVTDLLENATTTDKFSLTGASDMDDTGHGFIFTNLTNLENVTADTEDNRDSKIVWVSTHPTPVAENKRAKDINRDEEEQPMSDGPHSPAGSFINSTGVRVRTNLRTKPADPVDAVVLTTEENENVLQEEKSNGNHRGKSVNRERTFEEKAAMNMTAATVHPVLYVTPRGGNESAEESSGEPTTDEESFKVNITDEPTGLGDVSALDVGNSEVARSLSSVNGDAWRVPPAANVLVSKEVTEESSMNAASIAGIALGIVTAASMVGAVSYGLYRRRYQNKPQTLNDSNPDSSGYLDDSTLRENSEEMYSLDNDSFLNSLEAMTIQNYWTDSVKHTKL